MSTSTLMTFRYFPAPAYGPRRDYSYLTEEPSISRICRAMGKEPMPYQRYVWAVGTEYRLDSWGRKQYHYDDVLVSTPRQSGKTTLLRPLRIKRMIDNDGAKLFSTAQTQKHASKRMLDMVNDIDRTIMAPLFKPRRGKGDAGLLLKANGSDLAQFTPNEEALHGETPIFVDLDEIWMYSQLLGDGIIGGARPGMITLHGQAQRWYTSTRGTLESEFMNTMVDACIAGERPRTAFFCWEMPEGMDPYDPATWWTYHPALGNTIPEDALASETDLPPGEFMRGYGNRLTERQSTFMPLEDYDLLTETFDEIAPIPLAQATISFEVGASNENAAVVACWHQGRTPVVKLVHQAPGTAWLPDYLRALKADDGVTDFAADGEGPVKRILDHVRDDLNPRELKFAERRLADFSLITAMRDDAAAAIGKSSLLRIQVANAALKKTNGVEMFDRDKSTQPIPALVAAAVGLYANAHPIAAVVPLIVS